MENNEALVEYTVRVMMEGGGEWECAISAMGPQLAADAAAEKAARPVLAMLVWHPMHPDTPFLITTV